MRHAGPAARVVPGMERLPERQVDELAFQEVHLLGVVVDDHAGITGIQAGSPIRSSSSAGREPRAN